MSVIAGPDDIRFVLSGGTTNSNVNLSTGGPISDFYIPFYSKTFNNLWSNVSERQVRYGYKDIRVLYLKNVHPTLTFKNARVYWNQSDNYTSLQIGRAPVNGTETTNVSIASLLPTGEPIPPSMWSNAVIAADTFKILQDFNDSTIGVAHGFGEGWSQGNKRGVHIDDSSTPMFNQKIARFSVLMRRVGPAHGKINCKIWDESGQEKASLGSVDSSALGDAAGTSAIFTFTNQNNQYAMQIGDIIGMEYPGSGEDEGEGSVDDRVLWGVWVWRGDNAESPPENISKDIVGTSSWVHTTDGEWILSERGMAEHVYRAEAYGPQVPGGGGPCDPDPGPGNPGDPPTAPHGFLPIQDFNDINATTGYSIGAGGPNNAFRRAVKVDSTTATILSAPIARMTFLLRRVGNPTGSVTCRIWNSAGSVMETLGQVAVTGITNMAPQWTQVPFTLQTNVYQMKVGDLIGIEYTTGTPADHMLLAGWSWQSASAASADGEAGINAATDKFGVQMIYANSGNFHYEDEWEIPGNSDSMRWDFPNPPINAEMTCYFFKSSPASDTISCKIRGGRHTDSDSDAGCCYIPQFPCTGGQMQFEIECPHPNNHDCPISGIKGSSLSMGSWHGYKCAWWNVGNPPTAVHMEAWQDKGNNSGGTPTNQWEKLSVHEDSTGNCGNIDNPLFRPKSSSSQCTFRIDNNSGTTHKWLSVVEIQPGQGGGGGGGPVGAKDVPGTSIARWNGSVWASDDAGNSDLVYKAEKFTVIPGEEPEEDPIIIDPGTKRKPTTYDQGIVLPPLAPGSYKSIILERLFPPDADKIGLDEVLQQLVVEVDATTEAEQPTDAGQPLPPSPAIAAPPPVLPVITNRTPASSAFNVPLNTDIVVDFNKALLTPIPANSFELFGPGPTEITAVLITIENSNTRLRMKPLANLSYDTLYTATIRDTIQDIAGNHVATQSDWSFRTQVQPPPPDTTPPTFVSIDPVNGATNVIRDKTVIITMSETILESSITTLAITIAPSIAYTVFADPSNDKKIHLVPSATLLGSTQYTITLVVGGLKDLAGNGLASQQQFSFTTEADPPPADTTPPTIVTRSPTPSAANVVVTSDITVDFSEPLLTPIPSNSFELFSPGPVEITAVTITLENGNTRLRMNPNSNLAFGTVYTVFVRTTIEDAVGNNLASESSWSFTTESSPPPPTEPFPIPAGFTRVGSYLTGASWDFWDRFETNYASGGTGPSLRWDCAAMDKRDMLAGYEFKIGPRHGTRGNDQIDIKFPRCVTPGGERGVYLIALEWYTNNSNSTGAVGSEWPHPTTSMHDYNADDPQPTIGNIRDGQWHGYLGACYNDAQGRVICKQWYNPTASGLIQDYIYIGSSIDTNGNIPPAPKLPYASAGHSGGTHSMQLRIDEIPSNDFDGGPYKYPSANFELRNMFTCEISLGGGGSLLLAESSSAPVAGAPSPSTPSGQNINIATAPPMATINGVPFVASGIVQHGSHSATQVTGTIDPSVSAAPFNPFICPPGQHYDPLQHVCILDSAPAGETVNGIIIPPLPSTIYTLDPIDYDEVSDHNANGSFREHFLRKGKDLNSVVIGGYIKCDGPDDEEITAKLGGGVQTSSNAGVGGRCYNINLRLDGNLIYIMKEAIHAEYHPTGMQNAIAIGPRQGHYTGVIFMKINVIRLGDPCVRLLAWIDTEGMADDGSFTASNQNWIPVLDAVDDGHWFDRPWLTGAVPEDSVVTLRTDQQEEPTYDFRFGFAARIKGGPAY